MRLSVCVFDSFFILSSTIGLVRWPCSAPDVWVRCDVHTQAVQKYSGAIEGAVKDDPVTVSKYGIPAVARYYFHVVRFLLHSGAK